MYCKFSKLSTFLKNDLKSLSSSSFLLIIYSVFFKLLLNPNGLPYIFSSQEISLSFNARHPIPSHYCSRNTGYFCKIQYSMLFSTAGYTWIIQTGEYSSFCGPFLYRRQSFVHQQHSILCACEKPWQKRRIAKGSKMWKFLFSTLKYNSLWSIQFVPRLKSFQIKKINITCKWSSNHHKWQQRIIKNDKWSISIVYLENSWTYTILFNLFYHPYNC